MPNFIRHIREKSKLPLAVLPLALTILILPVMVMAEKGDLVSRGGGEDVAKGPLYITLGKAELVDVSGDIADVMVADPTKIEVKAVQSNRLYVIGLAVGDTNMIVMDDAGNVVKRLDVHVKYDLQAIQSLVNDLYPQEHVEVRSVHDQILLTGKVSNPQVGSKIASIVGSYVGDLQDEKGTTDELISNLLQVRGEQQVMLQVKIVEASRSALKELGVDTNSNDEDELAVNTIFGTAFNSTTGGGNALGLATGAGIALAQDPAAAIGLIANSGVGGIGTIGLFLSALEEENLIHVLAEPNLTAVSGEQAGFLAGGEFPVPVGRDQTGNVVIEFREFGVSLNFKPVVLTDGRISLQLNTEVSSLDFDNAVILADLTVPGLDVRRAETTVEVPSGASLMIAGLLQSEAIKGMAGLPGIRKTPVIGDLVKSDSFQRNETELVVIVTPYLVEPYGEEKRAEHVPAHESNPLEHAFEANIRRAFDIKDEEIFAGEGSYGYLLQ